MGAESSGRARRDGSAKDGLGPGHGGVNYKANLRERDQWVSHCRKKQKQRRGAEKSQAEEHATWESRG